MSIIQEVTVPKFKTADGKTWPSHAEAEGHNCYLANSPLFEGFIAKLALQKAQAGLMRRLLPQFIAFQASFAAPAAVDFNPEVADVA